MLTEQRFTIEQGDIAALSIGEVTQADFSLLFIHGWLDNAASFISLMSHLHRLAPTVHCCAIDLPGHGLSSHKAAGNYYPFHDYIDDIYQIVNILSPNRLVLVGHSLGALIASCYSAAFPEQVSGLVQIEGFVPLSEAPENHVERLRSGVLSRQRSRRKPKRGYPSLATAIAHRAQVNAIEQALIAPVVERGIQVIDQHWQWRHDTKLNCDSLYRLTPDHAQVIREHITCPHQIILGDQGFASIACDIERYGLLHAEIHHISGGHHCHLEQPSIVAERILGLVNKF